MHFYYYYLAGKYNLNLSPLEQDQLSFRVHDPKWIYFKLLKIRLRMIAMFKYFSLVTNKFHFLQIFTCLPNNKYAREKCIFLKMLLKAANKIKSTLFLTANCNTSSNVLNVSSAKTAIIVLNDCFRRHFKIQIVVVLSLLSYINVNKVNKFKMSTFPNTANHSTFLLFLDQIIHYHGNKTFKTQERPRIANSITPVITTTVLCQTRRLIITSIHNRTLMPLIVEYNNQNIIISTVLKRVR
ncbi:hypothetical protein AGLY_010494 [Aphis glycines]|uniref:Uncharacterized protein n=1 Tax=Aphis glycines TaxID=307491 RepID=A0A6G0TE42_APHGL|nr:hypothetical protein AGLY_010494 [Aphis glycines]